MTVDDYQRCLDVIVRLNVRYLAEHPNTPSMAEAGFHDPNPVADWRLLPSILQTGGDVDDLACWMVAELRAKGVQAEVAIRGEPGKWLTCFVKLPDGTLLDPLQSVSKAAIIRSHGLKVRAGIKAGGIDPNHTRNLLT